MGTCIMAKKQQQNALLQYRSRNGKYQCAVCLVIESIQQRKSEKHRLECDRFAEESCNYRYEHLLS